MPKPLSEAQKLAKVERVNERLRRHVPRKIVGVMPPVPLSVWVDKPDAESVILRWMITVDGIVSKIAIYAGKFDGKTPVVATARIENDAMAQSANFHIKPATQIATINLPVKAGDRLEVSVAEPERIGDVWIGMLLEIQPSKMVSETFINQAAEALLTSTLGEE